MNEHLARLLVETDQAALLEEARAYARTISHQSDPVLITYAAFAAMATALARQNYLLNELDKRNTGT